MPQVFISHSVNDQDFIEKEIIPTLDDLKVSIWYSSKSIPTGSDWERSIQSGLAQSEWFMLVMSQHSAKSLWVRRELLWAMDERNSHVIPVMIGDCNRDDFHLGLRALQHVDFRRNKDDARNQLQAILKPPSLRLQPGGVVSPKVEGWLSRLEAIPNRNAEWKKLFDRIGNALYHHDLDSVLGTCLEIVFSQIPAQRGIICMCIPNGQLQPVAVRSFEPPQRKVKISLSIVNEAIHSKSSVLVEDVLADDRFANAQSVVILNIASAICVPLFREGHIDGLIYVDTKSREERFNEDHRDQLSALASIIGGAIEQFRMRDAIIAEIRKNESAE